MSKRKINKQQRARIKMIQTSFQTVVQYPELPQHQGLVLSRFGHHAEIEISENKILHCAIRPNLDNIVAGDHVICLEETTNQGVVVSLLPRQSLLTRNMSNQTQKIIAANITQLIIVIAPVPEPNWLLIDSYLVKADNNSIQAIIVLNKSDLNPPLQSMNRFTNLGYEIIETSCVTHTGHERLFEKLQNQTSVFIGQSGVGKSSLIGACLPDIAIAIAKEQHQHGRHTTSNARLYHLPKGGDLIDSPGIRNFDLGHLNKDQIIYGFREFRRLAAQCRFRNCNHSDAPDCAIIRAVNQGVCDKTRYENFLGLLHDRKLF